MISEHAQPPHEHGGPRDAALPWIDWLRFLAALQVFLFHMRMFVLKPYDQFAPAQKNIAVIGWFAITHFGREAVVVFFALSGYLVGGALIERVRAGTFKLPAYAVDRTTRLMLPFVPISCAAIALQAWRGETIDLPVVLANLVSLQGVIAPNQKYLEVDWSLAYETWFYILGGALAACVAMGRGHFGWSRAAALGVVVLGFLVFTRLESHLLFCWTLGALASQVKVERGRWWAVLAGCVVIVPGLLWNSLFAGPAGRVLGALAPSLTICEMVITLGVLIIVCNLVAMPPRKAAARRGNRLGTRLAAFSYSLYLVHIPLLCFVQALGAPDQQALTPRALLQYAAYVVGVPLAAYGFYWLFERHTDAVRRWLKRRLKIA